MRHIRNRRRFKLILVLLFIMCLIVFIENRIEDLIPQLKSLAEKKVEDALGGKVRFSVGSIDGGIIHPMVFNDIRVRKKGVSEFAYGLIIDSIETSYYVKDIIKVMRGAELPPIINKNSSAYIKFSLKNGGVRGFIGLYGDLSDARLDGYVVMTRGDRTNFSGQIKDGVFSLEIRPERLGMGSVRASGALTPDNEFIVNLKIDHLKAYGFDIASDVVIRNKLITDPDNLEPARIQGEFETNKLALNFKPFVDIRSSYKVNRDSVEVTALNLGEMLKAYGTVSLKQGGDIDMTVLANNISLTWLMLALGSKNNASVLSGTMNGKFKFKGPAGKMHMDTTFDIKAGTILKLNFDYMTATIRGDLPFLKIEDSRITRKSGYFALAGEMDLRRAGKSSMFDDIRLITDDNAITWDEWNATQGKDVQELNMKKDLVGQFGFGYKKFVREDRMIDESLRDTDEMHLDYKLQPNDSLKVIVGQDKDFFGFEHKDKF